MQIYKSDIIVIGSGGAGLSAAISAARLGKKVLVVSKLSPGAGSSTTVSNSSFRNSCPHYFKEQHYQDTLITGLGLNEVQLVKTLTESGEEEIQALKHMGVPIKEKVSGSYCDGPMPFARGAGIVKPMIAEARALGVEFVYPYLVWDIIEDGGQVAGAWGFEKNTCELAVFVSPVVILATGGAGAIYARTDNTSSITGDGYALILRAGLPLIDMEFVQFYPLYTAFGQERKDAFITPVLGEVAPLVNKAGEEISQKYQIERPLAVKSRDRTCQALMLEGEAYLDFTDVNENDWEQAARLFDRNNAVLGRKWLERKYLNTMTKIPIKPVNHFFMGGVKVDTWGNTSLPGLLAAGEVTGGLHGANRLEGNALTEAFVFGKRAGLKAATLLNEQGNIIKDEDTIIKIALNSALTLENQGAFTGSALLEETKQRFREIMWQGTGIIRNKESLTGVLDEVEEMKTLPININSHGVPALEFKNMLLVGEAITRAALFRTESRGSHFRTDYPERDDANWLFHSSITLANDRISVKTSPVCTE